MGEHQVADEVEKASPTMMKIIINYAILRGRNSQMMDEHQRLDNCEGAPLVLELQQAGWDQPPSWADLDLDVVLVSLGLLQCHVLYKAH